MIIIGESIHVISNQVRNAIDNRDAAFIQDLARRQVEAGAEYLDLNIGPQRRTGVEVMSWMVDIIQEVVDVPLCLDTTNAAAMEAGLERCKQTPIINSTDATPERLATMMPLAAKYNANIIALTLAKGGLPTSADARIQLALENIMPVAMEQGVPLETIFFDPLVLTINGNQEQVLPTIEAMRFFKQMSDPPPMTTCGNSNVSNSAPEEIRPVLNRVFMVMAGGAGLDSCIADALDPLLMEAKRIIEERDTSTPKGKLYVDLFDTYAAGETFDASGVDTSNEELRDIVKTIEVLENRTLYAHSYLRL
jgi:5-methyltetrahydrofolate corrinoid/iron sulfur protein methyltransferase